LVKGLPASPLLQTHGRRPDLRAANGARGLVGLLMIALSSLALIFPGRLNLIMNGVVPASLLRGMMAKMFKKNACKSTRKARNGSEDLDPTARGTAHENRWTGADTPSLEGRVAIDTGARSGVGYEIAFKLAAHGAHDVVTSRDPRCQPPN
jgi:hypothetical protein